MARIIWVGCALVLAVGCNPIGTEGPERLRFGPAIDAGGSLGNHDAGVQGVDAGDEDGGVFAEDAGDSPEDGGLMASDAGQPADAGPGAIDGGEEPVCSSKTQFIYTLSQDNTLSTFYPPDLSFQNVGHVNCRSVFGSPFSMAVDRNANIWTVFTDGKLYRLNPTTAACTATSFATFQSGFTTFGMGFSANSPGSWDETLFVSNSDGSGLAKIDTTTLRLTTIGGYHGLSGSGVTGRAELTGTGDGQLYGAFEGNPFQVNEINKANATIISSAVQPGVTSGSSGSNFAFASWNGVFYLFVGDGSSTNVYKYDPATSMTTLERTTNLVIVGAGVSTCAPSGGFMAH